MKGRQRCRPFVLWAGGSERISNEADNSGCGVILGEQHLSRVAARSFKMPGTSGLNLRVPPDPSMRTPAIVTTLFTLACASSDAGSIVSVVDFGGNYTTIVSLAENSCGAITVQNNPTVVTHDTDSGAITLTHAGVVYTGRVIVSDSSFTTVARQVNVGDGYMYRIEIAGRFRANAFDASATVDRTKQGEACRFVVHWAGTRA